MATKRTATAKKAKTTDEAAYRIVGAVTPKFVRSEEGRAIEAINPLANLTASFAQQVFDLARTGNYTLLQRIYADIERTDTDLLVCVNRRAAALSELDLKVVRTDERLNRGVDEALVKRQIAFLETEVAQIDNLRDAIEHLALAAFRGYAHVSPVYHTADKLSVRTFELLDQWNLNFCRRRRSWLWNPKAEPLTSDGKTVGTDGKGRTVVDGLVEIPPEEIVTVVNKAPIDWPGLMIYLRKSLAEKNWGVFVERYGIPPVILTMPDFAKQEDADKFLSAAESVFDARNGVVPAGTIVNYATEARGADPFQAFIEHQQKLIVLMATGGTLTSLTESGSGTLAGSAHLDTWKTIVRRDARIIAEALNKQLFRHILKRAFPDEPTLAEVQFETEPDPTPEDVFKLAVLAKQAGLQIAPEEISQMTGYTVTAAPEATPASPFGNAAPTAVARNASETPSEREEAEPEEGDVSKLAKALRADFAPLAKELTAILGEEDESERQRLATDLLDRLDTFLPKDPQMAAVIADAMEREFKAGERA